MRMSFKLRSDERGSAAIEMAIATPVLALFLYGIFQIGVMFQAMAGMQHGLGEGARYATIFPTPTNAQIASKIDETVFGVGVGDFDDPTVTDGTGYKDLSVTFSMETNFLFFEGPEINITQTKRAYTYQASTS